MESMIPNIADFADAVKFNGYSWAVIVVYMILTTWLGHRLSGSHATIRDFFLGGRKIPWYAVSGSVIATELSAMTLVGAPAFLWAASGDMSYAVLAIGTILGRIIVGYVFVPKYYEQEIYSPYEYIGNQLGHRANRITSFLFMMGGILGQGTRVLLTAIVLEVVTGMDIYACIWIVGFVSVVWTWMGGITTVIWTDVIQFLVFAFSSILTLVIVGMEFHTVDGQAGVGVIVDLASKAGKFNVFNWEFDLRQNYTVWAAVIASTIGSLAAYGTDQMMVQRCFCCKGPQEARRAIIWSSVSQVLMLICLLMGVGLWAYYQKSGLPDTPNAWELHQINENPNRLVPVFIRFRVHWFFGGLMVAGIFAAAISSLDSILAALAQQSMAWVKKMAGHEHGDAEDVRQSRMFVVLWAVVLCGMASLFYFMADNATLLIELALSVVGFVQGGILGAFLMAIVPRLRRKADGMEFAAALSVMSIFAISRHGVWDTRALIAASVILVLLSVAMRMKKDFWVVVKLLPFLAFIFFLNVYKYDAGGGAMTNLSLGWPWYAPLGCLVMVLSAMLICEPKGPESGKVQAA
jgi:SSS family transporter